MSISQLRPAGGIFVRLGSRSALLRRLIGWLSGRVPVISFAFAAALALAVLGAPRFAAQAVLLPVGGTLEALQLGAEIARLQLAQAEQALRLAHRIDGTDGRIATDLALVELLRAEREGTADHTKDLRAAIADLENGLSHAPANSFAWARLAGAHQALEGAPSPAMLAALRMSYVTGLYADKIMPFRDALALGAWDELDAGLRGYAKRELIYLWERRGAFDANQLPLMKTLCRAGRVGLLAEALIEGHRSTAEFDELFPIYLAPKACAEKFLQ